MLSAPRALVAAILLVSALPPSAWAATPAVGSATRRVVTIQAGDRLGSGFAYRHRGLLLTNAHVVTGTRRVVVVTSSGRRANGTVVALDSQRDLALIHTSIALSPLRVRHGRLRAGDDVYAIGSSLGLPGTVSRGVVSAIRQGGAIQTDAPVNPGNSGGPLLDGRGRVIGVTTSEDPDAHGIAFAVPISHAKYLRPGTIIDARSPTTWWRWAAVAAFALLLTGGCALLLRRRRRPGRRAMDVRLRPSSATVTSYDPEPSVRLKRND